MGHRVIKGLQWARPRESGPFGRSRARGAKAQGLRYERALAKALPSAKHGQWFEFCDLFGSGWCQPDLIYDLGHALLVLEAKYTWVPEGQTQIDHLYRPVVEKALGKPVHGVVVCKTLIPGMSCRVFASLREAALAAMSGDSVVLHWQGTPKLLENSHAQAA